ncbi:MAG: hypothetical protein WB812_13675 [Woeseiaceae bacterium]
MNESPENERFTGRAQRLFDDSVNRLDAATLSRLNRGRQRALAELGAAGAARGHWMRWVPATGVAAAALATVMMMNARPPDVVQEPVSAADFEMLLDDDDELEMLEDLEFYSWLDLAGPSAGDDVG